MTYQRLLGFTLIPLAVLVVWSCAWGLADVFSFESRQVMYHWEETGKIDDESAWERAFNQLQTARWLNPMSADYDFYQGKLHEWKALDSPLWTADSRRQQSLAIESYRRAITKRPSWNIVWASLAQSKFLTQQMDAETFDALEKALVFGPRDPRIQLKSIWIGFAVWEYLSIRQREVLTRTIQRSLGKPHYMAIHVINMAVQLGKEYVLRSILTEKWQRDTLENKVRKRRKRGL